MSSIRKLFSLVESLSDEDYNCRSVYNPDANELLVFVGDDALDDCDDDTLIRGETPDTSVLLCVVSMSGRSIRVGDSKIP